MKQFPTTITGIKSGLEKGDFSAVELINHVFQKIETLDKKVQAFLTLDKEGALSKARRADEIGYSSDAPALNGIPFALKDNIMTKGIKTTCASKMLADFYPTYDATVYRRLEEAGGILIGKLNMDEFAMGSTTETSYFHLTYNPWDFNRISGGSSGGSAAAVASRQVPFSLGTDTGGSIRQPAAYTGLVGVKPTYGAVSRYGVAAFASSFDQVGPLALTVEDAALILDAIVGVDEYDMTTLNNQVKHHGYKIGESIAGLKIGYPKEFKSDKVNIEIRQAVEQAQEFFESQGAVVEEVSLPSVEYGINAYYILSSAEAASNLQRFDGIRYGYRSPNAKTNEDVYIKSRSEGFGPEVKRRIMLGTFCLSSENYDSFYNKAARVRTLIIEDFNKIFDDYDLILGPVTTSTAPTIDDAITDPVEMYIADVLTVPVNLAGLPAISFHGGFDSQGLPIGIQLIGKSLDEPTLLQVAHAFEVNHEFSQAEPKI